jgi:hypothetical protein
MRSSIMRGYCDHICMIPPKDPLAACLDYIDTVTSNIRAYLRDKTRVMSFEMEEHAHAFPAFVEWIGAEGDLGAAMAQWQVAHNCAPESIRTHRDQRPRS